MTMGYIQFYKNKYNYPHFTETLTKYGGLLETTPVAMNFRTGTLRVRGDMHDFMSCNYFTYEREGALFYAWVEDVRFMNAGAFEVSYSVDAWRTYKSKINLGTQYIARHPNSTNKYDKLLGKKDQQMNIESKQYFPEDYFKRYLVVQLRVDAGGTLYSNSPVNPTPYNFFFTEYQVNNWMASEPVERLMNALQGAEPKNVVTMYSIPYVKLSELKTEPLIIQLAKDDITIETGFKCLRSESPINLLKMETPITFDYNINEVLREPHSVNLVIPEAGTIHIPDELLVKGDLRLRQDVDMFSGASNYMLVSGENELYNHSARGSSLSSIPVVSDPMDTYMSQNQNALTTALMGDVASIAGGAMALGSGAGALAGAQSIQNGVNGILQRNENIQNISYSNPPAYLGTALASHFNQTFWIVTQRLGATNVGAVNSTFGYPLGMVTNLVFPSTGFIQTEGCMVSSTDGSVPKWAIEEINSRFNSGILVH